MSIFPILIISMIIYNIFLVKYFKKNDLSYSKSFIVGLYILTLYLGLVILITGPGDLMDIGRGREVIINLIPFKELMKEKDMVLNMFGLITNAILFIPLGMLLSSLWRKFDEFFSTVMVGIGLSLIIEILQLLNIRATDIDDLLMNTLGTIIGYLIYAILLKKRTLKCKVENNSGSFFAKYNAEIFIGMILLLNFFIVPYVDRILYKTLFGI